jgi:phosphonoacetate hydrolase
VTTNYCLDEASGMPRFLEDPAFILVPTLFERFRRVGVSSAVLTCKSKTLKLMGEASAVAAEEPDAETVAGYGPPPPMYSAEVNYWLWTIAIHLLKTRPDLRWVYVLTRFLRGGELH